MFTSDDLNVKLPLMRKLGFIRHLIKPVRRAELLAAANEATRYTPAPAVEATTRPAPPTQTSTIEPVALTVDSPPNGSLNAGSFERPLRILVADDSEDNRLLIDAFLKKTGCRLEQADNGEVAVRKFIEGRYDVVLMDIQMPVLDGYHAVRQIREWERTQGWPHTPVIALTASVLDEAVGRSFEAGCDTHVSKPVRRGTLLNAIREAVSVDSETTPRH